MLSCTATRVINSSNFLSCYRALISGLQFDYVLAIRISGWTPFLQMLLFDSIPIVQSVQYMEDERWTAKHEGLMGQV